MATALTRTVILYLFITAGLRLMGKRQIGELEPVELVLTMMLSDLATVPMQDFGIPLLAGLVPILVLLSLSLLLSQLSLCSLRFRNLICGTPAVIIHRGRICQDVMRKNRITIDELLEELRMQGYPEPSAVKYAVLENSGKLSVLPWPSEVPPSASQLQLSVEDDVCLPLIIINDGRVVDQNLMKSGKDAAWLQLLLREKGLATRQVFLLTLAENGSVTCIRKETF